jgi:hypothetical protein
MANRGELLDLWRKKWHDSTAAQGMGERQANVIGLGAELAPIHLPIVMPLGQRNADYARDRQLFADISTLSPQRSTGLLCRTTGLQMRRPPSRRESHVRLRLD